MTKVIYDGVHNGYGFEVLYLWVEDAGTLRVGFPDGDTQVFEHKVPDLEPNAEAEAEWRLIFEDGITANGMSLSLFEEEDTERLPQIAAITEAAGLGAPFLLDYVDGTVKGRWQTSASALAQS
jgi:hypothetical protein